MWKIIFYSLDDGTIPIQVFLESLPEKLHAKALRDIDMLEKYGTMLTEPHVKHVEGKLWELRVKLGNDISRIFYFIAVRDTIVLLHGFVKKTQRIPKAEIERAKTYLEDYQRRHNQ